MPKKLTKGLLFLFGHGIWYTNKASEINNQSSYTNLSHPDLRPSTLGYIPSKPNKSIITILTYGSKKLFNTKIQTVPSVHLIQQAWIPDLYTFDLSRYYFAK